MDVAETECEELFKRTVGPIKEIFIIYNNQGRSKGMAVVTFQRATDAVLARSKYNGKVIDGKHKLHIELVTDNDEPLPEAVIEQPSLLSRISGKISGPHTRPESDPTPSVKLPIRPPPERPVKKPTPSIFVAGPKKRTKKGPKRVKKSVAQLDQEMEDYRAATDRKVA
jgi:THO complex subunit 4